MAGARVTIVVQLLFDMHHVASGVVILMVVALPEHLQVAEFMDPGP